MTGADVPPILAQDFDAGSLYALRAAVAAHAIHAGVPEPRARDIVLAMHEFAVNAIRHGAGHGQLLITAHDGTLHCQVTDDGKPPAPRPSPGRESPATTSDSIPWPSQHGHGLWTVRQIADHVSVQSGLSGTVATASFTLPPHSQQQPPTRSP
jgi:anti-sigma regulatory factor (Ser/Thr protein kinase)